MPLSTNDTRNVLVDAFVSIAAKTREGVIWYICHEKEERIEKK